MVFVVAVVRSNERSCSRLSTCMYDNNRFTPFVYHLNPLVSAMRPVGDSLVRVSLLSEQKLLVRRIAAIPTGAPGW